MHARESDKLNDWHLVLSPGIRRPAWFLGSLVLVCSLAAIYGLGFCYRTINPTSIPEAFSGVSRDKWIEDGATLHFSELAPISHHVTIRFGSWQAVKGVDPLLRVEACGRDFAELLLTGDALKQRFTLPAGCTDLSLHFPDAPVASPTDPRLIGAQFTSVTISSPLGVPIFRLSNYLSWFTLIICMAGALLAAARHTRAHWWIAVGTPFAFCALAANAHPSHLPELSGLWIAATLVVLGFAIAPREVFPPGVESDRLPPRFATYLLVLILLLGASLRFYGITFGLPELFHTDEGIKAKVMKRMVTEGSLDPRYFLHPSLLLYLAITMHFFVNLVSPDLSLGSQLILGGRIVSAIAGTLSIYFLYALCAKLYTRRSALLAAALFAFAPLAITCSRYLKEDSLFCMFFLLTALLTIGSSYDKKPWLLWLAGLTAGLCASSKYTGGLAAIILLTYPWLSSVPLLPDKKSLRTALKALCLVPVGFLLGTPYALLNTKDFIGGLHSEHQHMLQGHHGYIDPWSHFWVYHLTRSIAPGVTLPVCIAALIGLGIFLKRHGKSELLLIALVLLIYMPSEWVKAKPAPQPERYILGCLPFLAIIIARSLTVILNERRQILLWCVAALLVLAPLLRSTQLASEIRDDTRIQMSRWISSNIPEGSAFLIEARYAPKLRNTAYKKDFIDVREFYSTLPLKKLQASSFDYLLISSFAYDRYFTQSGTDPNLRRMFSQIFESLPLVKEISPHYGSYGFHNPTLRLYAIGNHSTGGESR